MAVTSFKTWTIQLGVATVAEDLRVILGAGSQGTTGALRRLIHTDTPNFPTLTYFSNPDVTWNLDNDVLPAPIINPVLTLGDTRVVRFERNIGDVIITEQWRGGRGRSPMVTAFFRLLYEYLRNPPATVGTFLQWEPRDRNSFTYNIEILSLKVSSGGVPDQIFRVEDIREIGGLLDPGVPAVGTDGKLPAGLDDINPIPTGLIDQQVELRFRIVSKV